MRYSNMCHCHGFASCFRDHTDFTVMMDHEAEHNSCRPPARAGRLFADSISALLLNAGRECRCVSTNSVPYPRISFILCDSPQFLAEQTHIALSVSQPLHVVKCFSAMEYFKNRFLNDVFSKYIYIYGVMSSVPGRCGAEDGQRSGGHAHFVDSTPTAHHIFSSTVVAQTCCQSVQSHIDPHALARLKSRGTLSAFRPKTLIPHRAISYTLPHLMTPHTGTPSSPFSEAVFQRAAQTCEINGHS